MPPSGLRILAESRRVRPSGTPTRAWHPTPMTSCTSRLPNMMYQQGRLVICCDEKTGMQALGRPHPTQPAVPGKPERREQDYIRYGTRPLIASFIVPTGELIGDLGPTRTSVDFATHWITWPGSSLKSRALTGCWITSIPTGAWKSAVSALNCATSLSKRRSCRQANNGEPF